MSASMIGMRGRLQKEGEVIHIICDRIVDHDDALRAIGRVEFAVAPSRADGAQSGGGPDTRAPSWTPRRRTIAPLPPGTEQESLLHARSNYFQLRETCNVSYTNLTQPFDTNHLAHVPIT